MVAGQTALRLMRIQYFSDVHLEFGDCRFPQTDAEVLVAAGDIGPLHFKNPIKWLAQAPVPLVYVAGNHEYYEGDMVHTLAKLRRHAAHYPNVHFLERDTVEINGVRFIGTTLWTDYNDSDVELMTSLHQRVNDFRMIKLGGRELTPIDVLKTHNSALAWLLFELGKPYAGKTVVVTHHAPSQLSWPRGDNDPLMHAYCSSLARLAVRYPIDLWIHGHIHTQCEYYDDKLRVACNARGYFGIEHENNHLQSAIAEV